MLEANIPEAGYGKKIILRNISIKVDEGEIVAIIGPNGAGKSTLLKALMGIVKVSNGTIKMNGSITSQNSPEDNVRHGISFIPQGNRVFTELDVRENLEMGGYLLKEQDVLNKRIESVLEIFPDLKDRIKEDAGKLSGGEKQQLALARALMLNPRILFLDEPSLGLSPKLVTKAFDTVSEIRKQFRTTFLIVEQKVLEVLKIADRVYGLKMGEIVFTGTPEQLQVGNELRKIFII
jgi:branched-chain amino acid transport system ATP-binding protein